MSFAILGVIPEMLIKSSKGALIKASIDLNFCNNIVLLRGPIPDIVSNLLPLIDLRLADLFALIANLWASSLALRNKLNSLELILIFSCPSLE